MKQILIIGAGFSGTLLAVNLLRHEGPRATMVERRSDPHDRRAYQLHLTEGATPYLAMIKQASDLVHQRAIGELGEEATEALCRSLKILRANLGHL